MSITISVSAVRSHTPDVDTDEMLLISISVGADNPWCRKPHRSLRSFSLTGAIFSSILSHFARIQLSRSRAQYFTSTNHLSCGFISTLYWRLASKASKKIRPSWWVSRSWRHTPRLIVMHVVFRFLLKAFVYAAKHACKQLQCNKAKLLKPTSINRLHKLRGLG